MHTPPQNRPASPAIDTIYNPLDPLGEDDLPPGRPVSDDSQAGEGAEPVSGEQAADGTDDAPADDADALDGDVPGVSPDEMPPF